MATQTHPQRKLIIRNKLQADAWAKHYIDDDRYLMMYPPRMAYIATQLLDRADSRYHDGLRKIIEVCTHDSGCITLPTSMNTYI